MEENERREGVLKQHFALYAKKPSMKDCFVTVFIFMICTIIGLLFQKLHFTDTNIVTIYILGVLITSILFYRLIWLSDRHSFYCASLL